MIAYDYQNQRWTHGQDARAVALAQIDQEIDVLKSPGGAQYLKFIRRNGAPVGTPQTEIVRLILMKMGINNDNAIR